MDARPDPATMDRLRRMFSALEGRGVHALKGCRMMFCRVIATRMQPRSIRSSSLYLRHSSPGQSDNEFGKCARLGLDFDRSEMLLYNNVVTHRQAKPRPFSRWFGREKWIEHFFLDVIWYSGPIISNADFYFIA